MIKKTIKYTDYDGNEREETFYFNLTKAEILQMQLNKSGTLSEYLNSIISARNIPEIAEVFKKLLLASYGEKSPDGKYFRKVVNGHNLSEDFSQTEAFNILYTELATDEEKAVAFINGIIPKVKEPNKFAENVNN